MDQLDTLDRNKKLFPQKMWDLIHDERYQFCLRWSNDGQLVYLNRDDFEESYLKKSCNQFNTQKSISFVRQMNMYGFRKVDDCYYENDNFKRDCYHLLKNMIRRHPNKAPFNDYFPTTTTTNVTTNNNNITQLSVNSITCTSDPSFMPDTNTITESTTTVAAANNNNNNNNNNDITTKIIQTEHLQDVVEAMNQRDLNLAATRKSVSDQQRARVDHSIELAHHQHQHLHHHQHLIDNHHQQQQQQQQFHRDDFSTSASPTSDIGDDDIMDIQQQQQQQQQQHVHINHQNHHFLNNNNTNNSNTILDHSSLMSQSFDHYVRSLMQLHNHHQQPQDLSSHHDINNTGNNNNHNSNNRMSKSSSSSSGCHNQTPSPSPANNRFMINNNTSITSHHNSNNGSLSPTPSPSPSIDNNNINMINGHNNFQQQLSNILSLSNQALQLGNNNCPIKYDHIQVNEMINQAQIPPELQLELQHQIELQQQLAQLPPVSPLTKKLVTEICSRRNALMDQSALLDAARYTEKFINVLLDDALLIAQHSAGLDPADTTAQPPACSSIDASSLTLALKLLPSKLLSSLQIYNKP